MRMLRHGQAAGALAASGEETIGRIACPQYLLLALSLLLPPLGELKILSHTSLHLNPHAAGHSRTTPV